MVEVLKEFDTESKSYRIIKITDENIAYPNDYRKIVVQIKVLFLWIDIKEFYYEDGDGFIEREAEELFDKIVNPYSYGRL